MAEKGGAVDPEISRRIIENAGRLTEDAELLLRNGRFASALVLAIYAVEELGKASLAKWDGIVENASKANCLHHKKQAVLGSLYSAYVAVATVGEVLYLIGVDRHLARPEFIHPFIGALRADPDMAKFADGMFDAVVEMAAIGLSSDPKAAVLHAAATGSVEQLKRRGIYVDFDSSTKPLDVDPVLAREWVEHARFFFDFSGGAGVGYYPLPLPKEEFDRLFGEIRTALRSKRVVIDKVGPHIVDR